MSRKAKATLLAVVAAAAMFPLGTAVLAEGISSDPLFPISTVSVSTSETAPTIVPCYVNMQTPMSVLNVKGTTATVIAKVGSVKAATIGTAMRLQVYSNGKWSTVKTWRKTVQDAKLSTLSQKYTLAKGCKYRVYSTFTVGSESASAISKSVTVK